MAVTGLDDKWAWGICIGCFCLTTFIQGVVRSSGVFFASIVDAWHYSREEVSWPFNLCTALDGFGVFLSGLTSQIFIIRRGLPIAAFLFFTGYALSSLTKNVPLLILLIGIIGGLSQGYVLGSCYVLISNYFLRYRTTATGIAFSGAAFGGLTIPYLCNYLIEEYGLSGSFLLGATVSLHGAIGAMLCRLISVINERDDKEQENFPVKEIDGKRLGRSASSNSEKEDKINCLIEKDTTREGNKCGSTIKSRTSQLLQYVKEKLVVMKHPMLYVYILSFPMVNFSIWTWLIIIVDFGKDRGLNHSDASFLLSIASICELCGRVFYGWFVDYFHLNKRISMKVLFFCISINVFLMLPFHTFIGLCLSSACFGLLMGCFVLNRAIIPVSYFGLERMPSAMGIAGLLMTGVSFLRPPLIGMVRDKGGSYDDIFLVLGSLICTGGILWLLEPAIMRFHGKKESTEDDNKDRENLA